MSVSLCSELDRINWIEARKILTFQTKSGKDRQLSTDAIALLHYIAWLQFDDTQKIGISEKTWLIQTGLSRSAFYRQRAELEKTNLIIRVTRGNNIEHTQVNLRVNRKTLEKLPLAPKHKKDVPNQGQTREVEVSNQGQAGIKSGTELALNKDPIQPIQPFTTGAVNSENWNWLVNCLPHEHRPNMIYGKELDNELNKLLEAHYTFQQIKNKLNNSRDYNNLEKPYPKVLRMLKELWSDTPVGVKLADPVKVEFEIPQRSPATKEQLENMRRNLKK